MIDLRRRSVDYKEFIGAELILAAAVIVIGVCVQGGPAGWFIGPGNGGGSSASQVSAAEVKQDEEETSESAATSRETAAVVEPGSGGDSSAAAYSKVQGDGGYVAEIVAPERSLWGKEMILINPWHLLPEEYEADLEHIEYGHFMDACAAEHLRDMLSDCRDEGYSPLICSSYRERSKQERLFNSDVRRFMYSGMSEEEAVEETAKNVAVPGSSEHEAGLAVDIVYSGQQLLDERQEENDTQQWLMEHCWEYGFILRYPRDKQEITGITYEPWHYRYVGVEAAEYIMTNGLCLEEYLGVIDADDAYEWPGEIEEEADDEESGEIEEDADDEESGGGSTDSESAAESEEDIE